MSSSRTPIGQMRHLWRCSIAPYRKSLAFQSLLVVTFRPEFQPSWIGQPAVSTISLSRLLPHHTSALIAGVTRGKPLPHEILDHIVQRTDGVPLFVEELTSMLVESGMLREEEEQFVLEQPLLALAIPASLQASLMARLDRLAPVKEVAQIGATIGREFSYELLAAGRAPYRCSTDQCTRPTHRGWPCVSSRDAPERQLHLQARACAGRRIQYPPARPAAGSARENRPCARGRLPGTRNVAARTPCPSLRRGRPGRRRSELLAQGWRACSRALC